jgi:hypothetical protein
MMKYYVNCCKIMSVVIFSENECCDCYMKGKISPSSLQSVISDNEDNVHDDSDMQHGAWTE